MKPFRQARKPSKGCLEGDLPASQLRCDVPLGSEPPATSSSRRSRLTLTRCKLEPVPHGGHFVVVPAAVAVAAGLAHGARVTGTVNGVRYRSSLMKYSGIFHMGVHKATLAAAGAGPGNSVRVTIAIDDEPLPTDTVPADLARALGAQAGRLQAAWQRLAPSRRREYIKEILAAKQPETRARRIARTVEVLRTPVTKRQASTPRRAQGVPRR